MCVILQREPEAQAREFPRLRFGLPMPRFVILQHDHPELHWDLMLQAGETLRTWRLAKAPELPGEAIVASAIGDHRPMYLDYEGPVSGGRGQVIRWDQGTYEEETPGSI